MLKLFVGLCGTRWEQLLPIKEILRYPQISHRERIEKESREKAEVTKNRKNFSDWKKLINR